MGPVSGIIHLKGDNRDRHQKCREGRNCDGPGCKIITGKTAKGRKKTK